MLKEIVFWFRRTFLDKVAVGRRVMVYFPFEDEYAVVEVSSVKISSFTARFPDGEPDGIETAAYGWENDNDVEYDTATRRVMKDGRPAYPSLCGR